jgi:fluoroacetyl-CoA thioesterase
MKSTPRTGESHQQTRVVESAHTIAFAGLPPVLATPWLIWHLEHAALDLLVPHLAEGEISVGTRVELDHVAPALAGEEVTYAARVVLVDGADATFHVEARCGSRVLSRGLHKRRVVEVARLARRLTALS